MPLTVCETFYSIQGESTFAGWPCFFIRLSGCNLRCSYCDTTYAYTEGRILSMEDILRQVEDCGSKIVEVTGGEPLLQTETVLLLNALADRNYVVLLETNGSRSLRDVPQEVVKIMDLKCPSSGMSAYMDFNNLRYLDLKDQVKFVIQDRSDYEWAREKMSKHHIPVYTQAVLSPAWQKMEARMLAEWMLADRLPARMQIQLHKYLWPDRERKV
ncbi:MAG: radical SAM protein [Thermodesulfobacteriota bacterium]|nr:radical SAM protein [Thermodesulfobacteriota bacterium]